MFSCRTRLCSLPVEARQRLKQWLSIGLILVSLGTMYSQSLAVHMNLSADPYCFNDDARQQIVPFLRYHDTTLFPDDYISRYYLAGLPIGYRILYTMGAVLWDPITLSKVLPYVLLLIFLIGMALAAGRFGGKAAAWAALALCLSSDIFLSRMVGGLPRAFAYPFIMCAAVALVYGKPYLLSATVCLAAAFYPPMAVISGVTLAILLLLVPDRDRGDASGWSFRRRLTVVTVTALLAAFITLPAALGSRAYGRRLGPSDVSSYPEVGLGGRYGPEELAPFDNLLADLDTSMSRAFGGIGKPWLLGLRFWVDGDAEPGRLSPRRQAIMRIIMVLIVFGFIPLAVREPAARRLLVLFLAVCIGHVAARYFAPHLFIPNRYAAYPIPVLATIMLPAAAATLPRLAGNLGERPLVKTASVLALCTLCLLFLGGRGSERAGLTVCNDGPQKIYGYLGSLPPDALIAGWPMGIVENVPYLSRRQAFVTFETHQAFHLGYVEEMRGRMRALTDACFATTRDPLLRLRDEFGVTHLVIDRRHYGREPPYYFKPFDEWTKQAHAKALGEGVEVIRQLDAASVFREGPYAVLDLGLLKGMRGAGP